MLLGNAVNQTIEFIDRYSEAHVNRAGDNECAKENYIKWKKSTNVVAASKKKTFSSDFFFAEEKSEAKMATQNKENSKKTKNIRKTLKILKIKENPRTAAENDYFDGSLLCIYRFCNALLFSALHIW